MSIMHNSKYDPRDLHNKGNNFSALEGLRPYWSKEGKGIYSSRSLTQVSSNAVAILAAKLINEFK
jgi:hypothetical protein